MQAQRKKSVRAIAFVLLTALAGCSRAKQPEPRVAVVHAPVTKIAPPTPIQVKKKQLGGPTWNPQWDSFIERSLPPALLSTRVPQDVRHFCPRFYQLSNIDKRTFWAYFFQALAGAEAGLDPSTNVHHTEPEVQKVDAVSHRMVRSEGLLQLTYEDDKRYGCDFDWNADKRLSPKDPAKTILNPERNLRCGIKILTRQIIRHHKPLLSPTGYWSTLHPGTPDFVVFSRQMTNPPIACGRGTGYAKSIARTREIARAASRAAAQSPESLGSANSK